MISCPKCGAANDKTAKFCSLCLQQFEPAPAPMPGTTPSATLRGDILAPSQAVALDAHYIFPAPESIAKGKQKQVLLTSTELLSNTFSLFMENMKFYIFLSMAVSALVALVFVTLGGSALSTILPILSTGQVTPAAAARLSTTLVWTFLSLGGLVAVLSLVGQLAFMVATAEMSKGYELGIAGALLEAVKRLPSFLWITILQSILAGGLIIVGFAMTAASSGQSAVPALFGLILGAPVAIVVGTWFSLAAYVHLDKGTRGLAALAASKELIGARWPNVYWRFSVFGLAVAVIQAIPVIGWFIVAPVSAIFPWLLYTNLKYLAEATD